MTVYVQRPTKVDIISDDEENTSSVQPADAEIVFKPTVLRGHSDSGHCSAKFLEKYTPTRVNGFRRAKITDSLIDVSIDEVSQLQLSPSPSSDALIKDDEFVYPLVRQSSNGICILLSKDLFVETTLDKSIRVVHEGRYSVSFISFFPYQITPGFRQWSWYGLFDHSSNCSSFAQSVEHLWSIRRQVGCAWQHGHPLHHGSSA